MSGQKQPDFDRLPSFWLQGIRALVESGNINDYKGGLRQAHRDLKILEAAVAKNPDGSLRLSRERKYLNGLRLAQQVTSEVFIGPAFDEDALVRAMTDVLVKHGLLKKQDQELFVSARQAISLFSLCSMHNTILEIDSERSTLIQIGVDKESGHLCAYATLRIEPYNEVYACVPLYASNLMAESHLDSNINFDGGCITDNLEVSGKKLVKLV